MRKRFFCILIALLVATSFLTFPVSAEAESSGFDIDYWYSDSSSAGTWTSTFIPVYVDSGSSYTSLSTANLKSYLTAAESSWECTGFGYYTTSTSSNAELTLQAITRSTATSFQIPSSVVGYTSFTKNLVGSLYYGSSTKDHYIVTHSQVFLIESDATSTTSGAKIVAVHEIGHALGYFGHYANGNVMKPYHEDITSTTPSTNEKNHIGQLYYNT